jgi:hypothetical protein
MPALAAIPAFVTRTVIGLGMGVLVIGLTVTGYRVARSQVAMDVYQQRLAELTADYDMLRDQYNEAVRRTAVTELLVDDDRLTVVVRTAAGELKRIETSYDPLSEVHVDYLVIDGRLWIRRVYDDNTPPREGVLIDPNLAYVDWHDPAVRYGKTTYRVLSEGRWVVTVTGDGSLGLAPVDPEEAVELAGPPEVRDYEQIEAEARNAMEQVGIGDVLRRLLG